MGNKFKKFLAAVLSLILLATFCMVPITASAEQAPLKFDENGKFKVLIFSDVQDQYPVHQRVLNIMRQAIEHEDPDLVVFLGDMTEINTKDVNGDYRRTVEQILEPVVEAGVPYSIVFGNHDPQSYYDGQLTNKEEMLAVWQSIGDCRTIDANPELSGTGTCKVPIYSSNGNNLAFNLWMVDSGSYQDPYNTKSGYDNPHADQLAWMAANNDEGVNSLVFQHIPMPETYNLYVEDENGSITYGDKKYKLELKEGVVGTAGEKVNTIYAHDNTGEFAALKEMGNVLGVFSGHDHLNDFSGNYDGINITAVPGMTYFNYGNEAIRGYGVIELDEDDLSTYEYHSVKFSELDAIYNTSTETVYDEYDEITYADLKQNGNALGENYTISGGHNFTYDATSPSYSAVFKFRWTAGSKPGFQVSFDGAASGDVTAPFGLWVKRADQTEPYGAWHLKPSDGKTEVKMTSAAKAGDTYDIEMGRLKVLEGDAKYVGMYYLYLKVNGKLIKETYTNTTEDGRYTFQGIDRELNNVIRFGGWGNGGDDKISAYVEPPEQFADYDVVEYEDLITAGNAPAIEGPSTQIDDTNSTYYWDLSDEAAKTHSVIIKLRWTMETKDYFQIHVGGYGGSSNFAYRLNENGTWHDRATGATVAVSPRTTTGDYYDLEVARIMVITGPNKGKYYTYFKVDNKILFEKYVAADDANTTPYLKDEVFFGFKDNQTCRISATPYDPNPDSLYYAYDEVTYYDLLKDGNALPTDLFRIGGNSTFTYNKTSETGSAIIKFRWKEANAGSQFQLSFDREGSTAYMFGLQVYTPNEQFPNGYVWLRPGFNESKNKVELPEALEMGKDYDIEFARLKVKNGENAGKYYVYFKINNVLIVDDYVDASLVSKQGKYTSYPGPSEETICNKIYLTFWGNNAGNKIAASPYVEAYDHYDDLSFNDLFIGETSMNGLVMDNGNKNYTYNATSSSYSAVLKYRWVPGGDELKFTTFFDDWVYPFCFAAKTPNQTGFGATAGENGSWHLVPSKDSYIVHMDEPVVAGQPYDVEVGRLLVKNGLNKGKYYVYAKVNGELIKDYYYDGVVDGAYGDAGTKLSNKIIIASPAGNAFSAIPEAVVEPDEPEVPEEDEPADALYYAYDEIGYSDLTDANGNALGSEKQFAGGTTLKYNSTSATGSVIFKFRWLVGEVPKFQMSFEKASDTSMAYKFGAWLEAAGSNDKYPNGKMWLVPGQGPEVNMPAAITAGSTHDVEFARLKVKNGENAGKYYVYIKVDGVLVTDYYVAANVVDENGNYVTGPGDVTCNVKSGEIFFAFWDSNGNKITAIPFVEEYDKYDDIGFEDLKDAEGNSLGTTKPVVGENVFYYDSTSASGSVVFKYRWKVGSKAFFQMSFEKTAHNAMAYMFGVWVYAPDENNPNGKVWLRPSYDGPEVQFADKFATGTSHNVEFGRLLVLNGSNAGKYYVYLKIDDILIADNYVAANIVDANGNYVTGPGEVTCNVKSGEIFMAFWGSEGTTLTSYRDMSASGFEGVTGDFDGDNAINATDLVVLKKVLLGTKDTTEVSRELADYNKDGKINVLDLIAMKKDLAPKNNYSKNGSLSVGVQEHLLQDDTKTAVYIADAAATLGATSYRLSKPIHNLYYATSNNSVEVREDNMASFKEMVAELKAKGIDTILYVTDSFILPYGYADSDKNHNITVPDPITDTDNYIAWLTVNANAFKALAEAVPEIKFFEPFNEINTTGTRLERYGIGWNATDAEKAAHKFTVQEKAYIMADLCWYISRAVKSVDAENQVTTPSICAGSNSVIEKTFAEELYKAITSGAHPTNRAVADTRIDNYFTIINVHAYPDYAKADSGLFGNSFETNAAIEINEWAGYITDVYNVAKAYGDGDSRVWLTETGMTTAGREEYNVGRLLTLALEKVNNDLTFIDTVIFYEIANASSEAGLGNSETNFGLFYSGDDLDNGYQPKIGAKVIYSFLHNGSEDYSALDALAARYDMLNN